MTREIDPRDCQDGRADTEDTEIDRLHTEIERLRAEVEGSHAVLDGEDCRIIRNSKDGYPDGRADRILSLPERVQALLQMKVDYKRWLEQAEAELTAAREHIARLTEGRQEELKHAEEIARREGMEAMREAHGALIKIGASLLTRCQFHESSEDWPKTTPRSVIGNMKIHNDRLRDTAVSVRGVADRISAIFRRAAEEVK
jgi:hypothetical protein